jgi:hypothetical protein
MSTPRLMMAARTSTENVMTKLILALAAVAVAASTTASRAEWTKIGSGPSYDVAEAQCALMAMGAERGTIAFGSPAFVAGAAIGSAIGNAIRTSIVKEKCMTIYGWKNIRAAKGVRTIVTKSGKVKKVGPSKTYATGQICQRDPSACE